MNKRLGFGQMAIVGCGPTSIYLLKNILEQVQQLKPFIEQITIFEKERIMGMGMPYHPTYTDKYNLANISSEEIPVLLQSFGDYLRELNKDELIDLNITDCTIDDSKVYSRLALGHYFSNQYKAFIEQISGEGIPIYEYDDSEVLDIQKLGNHKYKIIDRKKRETIFSTVVIATGHNFKGPDRPESGYYASPWPIHKIVPTDDKLYNFPIGTLGASLSAFDVVTSLAHRHGKFKRENNKLVFEQSKQALNFKLVMHSAEGWLPHLQYEQKEPFREIYRHFKKEELFQLLSEDGKLDLQVYFQKLCRPALLKALVKDNLLEIVDKLRNGCTLEEFIEIMSQRHEYINSFEGMKQEYMEAQEKIEKRIPVYWMETLDDLMYSLNYHAELLAAEDHIFLHKKMMPFLMNVIAALPLQSAEILLALYDSGSIALEEGKVEICDKSYLQNKTCIKVKNEKEGCKEICYDMFINCSGQKGLELEDFPFESLKKQGVVRAASAEFNTKEKQNIRSLKDKDKILKRKDTYCLKLSGIDIDSGYRTINTKGETNQGLYDINFTHTNGLRPYSYGLQACHATSLILVESWLSELEKNDNPKSTMQDISEIYDETPQL